MDNNQLLNNVKSKKPEGTNSWYFKVLPNFPWLIKWKFYVLSAMKIFALSYLGEGIDLVSLRLSLNPSFKYIRCFHYFINQITSHSIGGSRISQTRSANPWFWNENLLFGQVFGENCMKTMKEIQPRGRCVRSAPSPWNHQCHWLIICWRFTLIHCRMFLLAKRCSRELPRVLHLHHFLLVPNHVFLYLLSISKC